MPRPAVIALLAALSAGAASAGDASDQAAPKRKRLVVVSAAALHDGLGRVLEPGQILVEDGLIKELGTAITIPEDAERIEHAGGILTPWLVDPFVRTESGRGETGRSESALLAATDARPVHDPMLAELRQRGVGALGLVPAGGAGLLGRAGATSTRLLPESGAALLREETALCWHLAGDLPGSAARAAARHGIGLALEDAEMARTKEKEKKEKDASSRSAARRERPRRDAPGRRVAAPRKKDEPPKPAREILLRAVDKKLPLLVELARAEDALAMLELAERRGLGVRLAGCRGCAGVAPEIGRSQALVILDPLNHPASDRLGIGSDPALVERLVSSGARLAVTGGGAWPEGALALRVAAGWLHGAGATEALAIAAMTGLAAEAAGVPDEGVLRAGLPARFLAWSRTPLDPSARIERAYEGDDLEPVPEPAP